MSYMLRLLISVHHTVVPPYSDSFTVSQVIVTNGLLSDSLDRIPPFLYVCVFWFAICLSRQKAGWSPTSIHLQSTGELLPPARHT